jgi:hypothetical protein
MEEVNKMKLTVLWVVVPCSLVEVTDVSEVCAASIIRTHCLHVGGSKHL